MDVSIPNFEISRVSYQLTDFPMSYVQLGEFSHVR